MMKVIQRLQLSDVFPEEKQEEASFYLKKISKETLLKSIGFCSTNPSTNFDDFFTTYFPLQISLLNVEKKLHLLVKMVKENLH